MVVSASVQQGIPATASLAQLDFKHGLPIFNLDLHSNGALANLQHYFHICKESTDLQVTTSCFSVWKQGKFKNGCAKVIPAVPVNGSNGDRATRVFFFDDNINLHLGSSAGSADAKGICNLREMAGGEYIDFSAGKNGFTCESAYRHTLIHHSSEYRNVMVQVNIMDAMSNHEYFTSIIQRYSQAGEKLIVYMDVNGTILWDDTIMGLGPDEILLITMLGSLEIRPWAPFDFVWEDERTVRLERPVGLKRLVHDLANGDNSFYRVFWTCATCENLLTQLSNFGDVRWTSHDGTSNGEVSPEHFSSLYQLYTAELRRQHIAASGMTASWFRCLSMLKEGGHSVILQSFGMDTQRVVRLSVDDGRQVLHIAVNFELWSERDTSKFAEQFSAPSDPSQDDQRAAASDWFGLGGLADPLYRALDIGACCCAGRPARASHAG
mmetsp:Transcript_2360/g.7151  ORF Transcript_2360/g.7151 Transcript_2360/m.7151 type:complete len:437 (-) Transcript_2360:85-1395(-)